MKSLLRCGLTSALLASAVWASDEKKTDAERYGLSGPVRSVSIQQGKPEFALDQKDWPVNVGIWGCDECEYDRQGTQIRYGQMVDGEFRGEHYQITRDGRGNVTEQVRVGFDGEVTGRTVYGPYGILDQSEYINGAMGIHSEWKYDSSGHVREVVGYDRENKIMSRMLRRTDLSGNTKEDWNYGSKDEFLSHVLDTYDPKTDVWTWTRFAEDGSVKVAIETQDGKVNFYRQDTSEPNPYGQGFWLDRIGRTQHSFRGHADGTYDDVVTIFPDESSHNPERMEWRDASGAVRLRVDYEYELDGQKNWTARRTFVWMPELGETKLYRVDTRKLTYWEN